MRDRDHRGSFFLHKVSVEPLSPRRNLVIVFSSFPFLFYSLYLRDGNGYMKMMQKPFSTNIISLQRFLEAR